MNEATLKASLVKHLRAAMPGAIVWRLEDKFAGGRPDVLIVWRGRVAAIEVKYERRGRRATRTELQRLTLHRLEAAGALALWLVYWHDGVATLERPDTSTLATFKGPHMPHNRVAQYIAEALDGLPKVG